MVNCTLRYFSKGKNNTSTFSETIPGFHGPTEEKGF